MDDSHLGYIPQKNLVWTLPILGKKRFTKSTIGAGFFLKIFFSKFIKYIGELVRIPHH
jgi:hypothetical protein